MIEVGDLRELGTLNPSMDRDLELLLTVCKARSLASGEVLYVQGERARSCFLLVRGRLQVERARAGGTQVIATLHPGTFVGQVALIDHGKRTASVRAAIAGIRQFRQAMQLIAAIPPARESADARRTRELDQVQAYLTDLGVTLDEVEYVQDGSRRR